MGGQKVALLPFNRTVSILLGKLIVTDAATGNVKLITELLGTTQFLKHLARELLPRTSLHSKWCKR